tara:strand:- start:320 stop:688 length:369 start_codon:yes stop_codon:yes gene_type:complete
MASTRLKNLPGMYKQESSINNNHMQYKTARHQAIPDTSRLPTSGINCGVMKGGYNNNILSSNAADVESSLFGIGLSNLVEKKSFQNPNQNTLGEVKFFEDTYVSLPEPLHIEGNQRPVIFRR